MLISCKGEKKKNLNCRKRWQTPILLTDQSQYQSWGNYISERNRPPLCGIPPQMYNFKGLWRWLPGKRPCCVKTRTWIWTFSTHLKVECGCGCLSSHALEGQRQVDLWVLLASQCNWNRGFRFSERPVSQNKVECERKESSEVKETEGQIETKCDTCPGLVLGSKKIFSLSIDIIHIAIMNAICTVVKKIN